MMVSISVQGDDKAGDEGGLISWCPSAAALTLTFNICLCFEFLRKERGAVLGDDVCFDCVSSQSLTGHKNPVESIHFNVSEEQVVAGSQSGSIRVWDLEAAKSKTLSVVWLRGFLVKASKLSVCVIYLHRCFRSAVDKRFTLTKREGKRANQSIRNMTHKELKYVKINDFAFFY